MPWTRGRHSRLTATMSRWRMQVWGRGGEGSRMDEGEVLPAHCDGDDVPMEDAGVGHVGAGAGEEVGGGGTTCGCTMSTDLEPWPGG